MPLLWFVVEVAWTTNASLCSCFRLKRLMKAAWWWGRWRWSLSHILKRLITASLRSVIYSVSSNTKFQSSELFYFVHIFPHWFLDKCALDGDIGTGKTMCLSHALHYCYTQGWLIVHIPDGELHWHSFNQNVRWYEVWSLMMLWCFLCSSSVGQEL